MLYSPCLLDAVGITALGGRAQFLHTYGHAMNTLESLTSELCTENCCRWNRTLCNVIKPLIRLTYHRHTQNFPPFIWKMAAPMEKKRKREFQTDFSNSQQGNGQSNSNDKRKKRKSLDVFNKTEIKVK